MGRPRVAPDPNRNVYRTVYELALLGATQEQCAACLGISEITFVRRLRDDAKMQKAMDDGRTRADARVTRSLYKAARGYYYNDHVVSTYKDRASGRIDTVLTPVRKYMHPNVAAAIFWLCNRQRGQWQSVNRIEVNGRFANLNANIDFSDLSDEQLATAKAIGFVLKRQRNGGQADDEQLLLGDGTE